MRRRETSVAGAVVVFAISGLLVLAVIGVAGVFTLRRLGTDEAFAEAERLATVTARGVVQPRLTNGILKGRAESLVAVDNIVQGAALLDPVVAVRVWDPIERRIIYASNPELIGAAYPMGEPATRAAATGEVASGSADLALPQNRFQREEGRLLEVAVPIQTPDGTELILVAALRLGAVQRTGLELWRTFLPVLALALIAFAAIEIPLAYRLARRVRESQRDRERLLQRAIDASDLERRRITSDLHDGLVQDFAGLAMSLSARADAIQDSDPEGAAALREGGDLVRQGMRSLRSAVMGIYPPTVPQAGLRAALSDLVAPLEVQGILARVEVPPTVRIRPEVESLLFRCAQEAVRNVASHARASQVAVVVRSMPGGVELRVTDDGVGFTDEERALAGADGHLGLRLLNDLVREAGGSLSIGSEPGQGTSVCLEVPG